MRTHAYGRASKEPQPGSTSVQTKARAIVASEFVRGLWRGKHDHCPLHYCSCHHGHREPLSRLAKQGLSQISGRHSLRHRPLCSIPVMPTHPLLLVCFYFGFVRKAEGLKRTAFRQPNEPLNAIEAANLNPDLDRALAYLISAGISCIWCLDHSTRHRIERVPGLDALGNSAHPLP